MESLPVELLQQIFMYCDPVSVRQLRLVSPSLASVGCDYLISPSFTALPWRDDVARLRAIAGHERLRGSVESVTFNLAEPDLEKTRHSLHFQTRNLPQTAELDQAWGSLEENEHLRSQVPGLWEHSPSKVGAALRPLSNLQHVGVAFTQCPYDSPIIQDVMGIPSNLKTDHSLACSTLDVVIQALHLAVEEPHQDKLGPLPPPPPHGSNPGSAPGSVPGSRPPSQSDLELLDYGDEAPGGGAPARPRVTSFSVDWFPLEVFRVATDRRIWFQSTDIFVHLTHLNLTFDWTNVHFPTSMFRAVNGLGYVLRRAPNLTNLSLAFHHHVNARNKFLLLFRELLAENAAGGMDDSPLVDDHGYGHGHGHGFGYGHAYGHHAQYHHHNNQHHAHRSSGGSSSSSGAGSTSTISSAASASTATTVATTNSYSIPGLFTFKALTDFSLKGVACEEHDLRGFLLRHADTLERVRLGGRGRSLHESDSTFSGVRLSHGSFRSLFQSLRGGRLPHLQRMHLEGDFDCLTESLSPGGGANGNAHTNGAGNAANGAGSDPNHTANNVAITNHVQSHPHSLSRFESYLFRATTDDDWSPASDERAGPRYERSIDSTAFEQYVLGNIDEYPGRIYDR